jgi:hypothetical protein
MELFAFKWQWMVDFQKHAVPANLLMVDGLPPTVADQLLLNNMFTTLGETNTRTINGRARDRQLFPITTPAVLESLLYEIQPTAECRVITPKSGTLLALTSAPPPSTPTPTQLPATSSTKRKVSSDSGGQDKRQRAPSGDRAATHHHYPNHRTVGESSNMTLDYEPRNRRTDDPRDDGACMRCGEFGHYATTCNYHGDDAATEMRRNYPNRRRNGGGGGTRGGSYGNRGGRGGRNGYGTGANKS